MDSEVKKQSRHMYEKNKQSATRILQLKRRQRQLKRQLRDTAKLRKKSPIGRVEKQTETKTRQTITMRKTTSSGRKSTKLASTPEVNIVQGQYKRNYRFINQTFSKLRSRVTPWIIYGDEFVFGGRERCRVGNEYDCYNANYKETMDIINIKNPKLRSHLKMGNDHVYSVLDKPIFAVARTGQSDSLPAFLAIHVSHLENVAIDISTIAGGWICESHHRCCSGTSCVPSSKCLSNFLQKTGTSGIPLNKLFPNKSGTPKATLQKGQTNFDNGFMVGAMPNNSKSWTCDAAGNKLPPDQFHAVRGSMGIIGGKAHLRAKELLTPCAPIADRLFNSWPVKLKAIPYAAQQAFDGSRRLTYTTVLLTVGNETKDACVGGAINRHGLNSYLLDKAGKYIHVDRLNTTKSPCVTITIGAYDGFRFCFPTLNTEIHAPSGTAIIGTFDSLLHAVSCGTGVRISLVYCQHEDIVTGLKSHKNAQDRHITGARRSFSDKKGKFPIIGCLSKHDYK
jgi:hypothetical protein